METDSLPIYLLFAIFASSSILEASINGGGLRSKQENPIKRSDFPPGFLFGAATSAYQPLLLGCGENGENGDFADDHYHLFKKDIELMHSLGLKSYRFSISWSRILPRGRFGEVNPSGIMFYNEIIDDLVLKGIEPFVTIHHQDFPQELERKYGSWLDTQMHFGDRVKYWVTINEPNLVSEMSYEKGTYPPAHCSQPFGNCLAGNSDVEPLRAMHNMLLAHGKAAKLYHERFQAISDVEVDEILNDIKRIEFHETYLESLAKAIRNGADVRGYFIWSLMDNYEWTYGYNVRFGLYYVDYKTFERVPKLSARWYQDFVKNNSLDHHPPLRTDT
ncbi:Glycoside hydrolase, catalytic domain-containing protein [Cynara cardunculus var. scolymus]|uniref:Glycoside hydrolase, catalytic domain-containing protein n=1 Tax=Cynara cardunculus var. scolymus TaxID=59895 RepID=A0A103YK18_CYNCS|nr:Glycoside hydrolase, catalytic domain-containing protein [Cynara cardunculus var. scolymus]